MVLSAKALGIRGGLDPVFCSVCGCRVCWTSDDCETEIALLECEDCAKQPKQEDGN